MLNHATTHSRDRWWQAEQMKLELKHKIQSILPFLTEEVIDSLISKKMLYEIEVKKGDNVLNEGEICKNIYFILSGSIRQFGLKDGEEINFLFYFESDFVFDEPSFYNKTSSNYYFKTLENCTILKFDKTLFDFLIGDNNFSQFLFNLSKQNVVRLYKRNEVLLMDTPKERYLKLLEIHPTIMEKVSLAKIASFIGITAPSLSRIRNRLVKG